MKTNTSALIITLSLLAVISAVAGRHNAMVGGYSPIKNINDPHVQEIAKYAVSKHNELDGTNLEYVGVVKGESQVVAGTNYRLQISAKDGVAVKHYQAVVYERVWENYRNLTSFRAV